MEGFAIVNPPAPKNPFSKYSPTIIYAYNRRTVGKSLPIAQWVRVVGKNITSDVFSPIEVLIDTNTKFTRFKIDPNLGDKWYLKLKKDIADSLGWVNLTLKYGGKELDQWSLDEVQNVPRYAIEIKRNDTLGVIDGKQFEMKSAKQDLDQDVSQTDLDEREELMAEVLTRLLMERTKDMDLEELIEFISNKNAVMPSVIKTVRNPICYDSNQQGAYMNFMKKYKVDVGHLCCDMAQKIAACGCGGGHKHGKKKKRKGRYIHPVISIGSHLNEENPADREQSKFNEIKSMLIGCNLLGSIRCVWDNLWACKKRCKCKKRCRCKKRCTCKGRCGCKRKICRKKLTCYRNKYSSSSESCSSDSSHSSSSDEGVNKYTKSGYLAVESPYKKYYHFSHVERQTPKDISDDENDYYSTIENNINTKPLEKKDLSEKSFSFTINSNLSNSSSSSKNLHNFTSSHDYKDNITFVSSNANYNDELPELIKISQNTNEDEFEDTKPIVKPYNASKIGKPIVRPLVKKINNNNNDISESIANILAEDEDSDEDIFISEEYDNLINKYSKYNKKSVGSSSKAVNFNSGAESELQVPFSKIGQNASNFMKILSDSNVQFNKNKEYKIFAPTNNALNNRLTNSILKKSSSYKSKFVNNYISDCMSDKCGNVNNYKTIGGKVFGYNPADKSIRGSKDNFTIYGVSKHPDHSNVSVVLQNGKHNEMSSF